MYEKIVQLKMKSSDGKNYKTDAANTTTILRIIQSIPSPNAEPFKRWLAEKCGFRALASTREAEREFHVVCFEQLSVVQNLLGASVRSYASVRYQYHPLAGIENHIKIV